MGRRLAASKEKPKEALYEFIKRNIQNAVLLPGEKVPELPLTEEFHMSRTPVREVLNKLCEEGLLIKVPHKGFFVRKFSEKERRDTLEVLAELDLLCAKKAMPFLTEQDLRAMEEAVAKIDVAIAFLNFSDYTVNQQQFHSIYHQRTNNRVLADTFAHIVNNSSDINITVEPEECSPEQLNALKRGNEDHRRLLQAFRERDEAAVEAIIKSHWKED